MTQMKRSPSSCSSSSSCIESDVPHQSETPKTKRARKSRKQEKCENGNSPSSGRRSSVYRGVTRHRWTGRFEAHLWDKSSWNNIQNKKGRQVYLGAYDNEEAAAHTYDLAALKYWGPGTTLNFPIETYTKELEEMEKATREEYLASLRRRSSGFSRGVSKYRGVARHHHNGRWEARIGRVFGNKYLYLGTYNTQEEAAAAYDMAAIEYRGANAVTNFDISHYIDRLKEKIPGFNTHTLSQPAAFPTTCTPLEVEVEVEQQPLLLLQQQQKHQLEQQPQMVVDQTQHTQVVDPTCIDTSATVVLDPANDQDPWSFLDSGFFSLPVPDFPLEKPCEITDLFDHIGFEEDIDFLFETACMNQEGANLTGILDDAGFGGEVNGVSGRMEQGEDGQDMDRLLSSSTYSSSSSTTTSVSYTYTG